MKPSIRGLAIVLVVVLSAGAFAPLFAQSLADVARKEEQRRKNLKEHAKVITNKDLGSVPAAPVAPPPETMTSPSGPAAAPGAAGSADAAKPADAARPADATKPAGGVHDQAYWAKRMQALQSQLDRDQTFQAALQSRINALTADFTARDDPAQRAVIEEDRQKALTEFNRLKRQIEADKKALADLEEEARRAGVPPGWLRS